MIVHDAQKLSFDDLSALSDITQAHRSKLILLNNSAGTLGFSAGNPIKLLKEQGIHSYKSLTAPIKGALKLSIGKQANESMSSAWLQLTPEQQQKSALVALNNKTKGDFDEPDTRRSGAEGAIIQANEKGSCFDDSFLDSNGKRICSFL